MNFLVKNLIFDLANKANSLANYFNFDHIESKAWRVTTKYNDFHFVSLYARHT